MDEKKRMKEKNEKKKGRRRRNHFGQNAYQEPKFSILAVIMTLIYKQFQSFKNEKSLGGKVLLLCSCLCLIHSETQMLVKILVFQICSGTGSQLSVPSPHLRNWNLLVHGNIYKTQGLKFP